MDKTTITSVGALLMAMVSLITLIKLVATFGEYRLKVDTMWAFLMQRAKLAGLDSGILVANSPLALPESTRRAFAPLLVNQLQDFYRTLPLPISDHELTFQLERKFGKQISEEVCPPLRIHMGECLIAAALICREVDGTRGEFTGADASLC